MNYFRICFVFIMATACNPSNENTAMKTAIGFEKYDSLALSRESGNKQILNYTGEDNKKQGYWLLFADARNITKAKEGHFLDNKKTGIWITYTTSEQIRSKITYENDMPNGYAVMYDDKGNITREGNYVDGVLLELKK